MYVPRADLVKMLSDRGFAANDVFFFSSRRRHTRFDCDWSSDVCSSDLRLRADPAMSQAVVSCVAAAPQRSDEARRHRGIGAQPAARGYTICSRTEQAVRGWPVPGGVAKHRQFAWWEEAAIALGMWLAALLTGRPGRPRSQYGSAQA